MKPKTKSESGNSKNLMFVVSTLVVLLWTVLTVAGCGSASGSKSASVDAVGKTQIVTTTGMIRDMVSEIVGPDAEVYAIMGAGVDPHLYQPTRGDAVRILEADVVVYNGLHLEGRLGEVMERREESRGRTIAVGELIAAEKLLDADAGWHDPHIWMDVSLWREAAGEVGKALAELMPHQADSIRGRCESYQEQLSKIDRWGKEAIGSIPKSQRILITAHDAFQYFGRRYDIEVHGVQGVSTESETGIQDVNQLVNLVVERKVPAIFFESSVSERHVSAIVEGAQQQGVNVSSDWTLLSDSMGADGTPEGTYVGMMQHNIRTIATALGGEANDFPGNPPGESTTAESVQESAATESVGAEN